MVNASATAGARKMQLTQEQVADALNVSVNTIQNWEQPEYHSARPENILRLLKFYEVSESEKQEIFLEFYDCIVSGSEKKSEPECSPAATKRKCIIEAPEKIVDAIDIIENRMECLDCASKYGDRYVRHNKNENIFGMHTANVIGKVGNERGIQLMAEEQYHCTVTLPGERYIDIRRTLYNQKKQCPNNQKKQCPRVEIAGAVYKMRREYYLLEYLKHAALQYLCNEASALVDVFRSDVVAVRVPYFYESITIRPIGRTYHCTSTPENMRFALEHPAFLAIDRIPYKKQTALYCASTYTDRETGQHAVETITALLMNGCVTVPSFYNSAEWADYCSHNRELRAWCDNDMGVETKS